MTSDEGYVHRPTGRDASADVSAAEESAAEAEPDGFGARGWWLVAAVALSLLVVPGVVYLYPAAPADAGLSFFAAMLALPMLPALLLGLTAVWSMTAAERR